MSRTHPLPWIALATAAVAAVAGALPAGASLLEYDRTRVLAGEIWRPLTGQMVHWGRRMAAVDLGAVAAFGWALETRSRRLVAAALAIGALAVGLGLVVLLPGIGRYRGASGLASALCVALALDLAREPAGRLERRLGLIVLAAFIGKIALETVLGRALFAGALPEGARVVPAVHLLGAAGGIAAHLVSRSTGRPRGCGPDRAAPP